MTAPRDPDRLIRSFLAEGAEQLDDPVFDAVRADIEHRRQRAVLGPWRTPDMNKLAATAIGAAVVVVVAVVGVQLLRPSQQGGVGSAPPASAAPTISQPSPSATTQQTTAPSPAALPTGSFVILTGKADDPGNDIPRLTVTIPAPDWYGEVGGGILIKNDRHEPPDGSGMIIFGQQEYYVYGDACKWRSTIPKAPVTNVDAFIDALSAQGSRDASAPVDITMGGYSGKAITLAAPTDVEFADCDPGYSGSWACDPDEKVPCSYHSGPGEIDTVYALDVGGVIIAWVTKHYPGTPAEDVAELEAIVQSATFGT